MCTFSAYVAFISMSVALIMTFAVDWTLKTNYLSLSRSSWDSSSFAKIEFENVGFPWGRKHLNLTHWQWHSAKCFIFIVVYRYVCPSVALLTGNICRTICTLFCLVQTKKRSFLTSRKQWSLFSIKFKSIWNWSSLGKMPRSRKKIRCFHFRSWKHAKTPPYL